MKFMADGKIHSKCHKNLTLTINIPSSFPSMLTIKEAVSMFHAFRITRKVTFCNKLHTSMIKLKLIRIIYPSVVEFLKNLDEDQHRMSNSAISDSRLLLR